MGKENKPQQADDLFTPSENWHLLNNHNRKKQVLKWAVHLVNKKRLSYNQVMERIKRSAAANSSVPLVSRASVCNYATIKDYSPTRPGGAAILPPDFNFRMVQWIIAKRSLKFPVFKEEVIAMANMVLEGSTVAAKTQGRKSWRRLVSKITRAVCRCCWHSQPEAP